MEAVRQFGSSTIGNGVLINSEQKMMGPVKVGKSYGVEFYQANVTFQSVMAGWASYIYMRRHVDLSGNRSIREQLERI